jgi:dethiobiotin synthetase
MTPLVVTGTDTGIGKTVVAAMLTFCLDGIYWKPIQSGSEGGTDTARVAAMTGLSRERFRYEAYSFSQPLSPHRASELDGVAIDEARLALPTGIPEDRRLIVEGAGGLLVPITRRLLQADLFARWRAPVILCARTKLGTINHSLLSLEALRKRSIPILGIIFVGEAMEDSERTICEMGKAKRLGRLPMLQRLDAASLSAAFAENFRVADFKDTDAR